MEELIISPGFNYIISIALSIVITWGIGLTPPLLIRYVFLKKTIAKKPAIIIASVFWFINFLLFVALGSRSKTHAALFLVAVASYYILRTRVNPGKQFGEYQSTKLKSNTDIKCKGCGKLLPDAQAAYMLNNPEYSEWIREGYCCLYWFGENYLQAQAGNILGGK